MSKIVPHFSGPLTANGLKVWLGQVEDAIENYQDTHKDPVLSAKTRIRLTGAALQEPQMAEWWSSGRVKYLALTSWEDFVKKLKERFLPVGWKMDTLERFYGCMQGKRDFRTFSGELAQFHGAVPDGVITDSIYKYHLLFFAHPQLYLCVRASPNFDVDATDLTVDILTANMSHQWDSLVAELGTRSGRSTITTAATAQLPPSLRLPWSPFAPRLSTPSRQPPVSPHSPWRRGKSSTTPRAASTAAVSQVTRTGRPTCAPTVQATPCWTLPPVPTTWCLPPSPSPEQLSPTRTWPSPERCSRSRTTLTAMTRMMTESRMVARTTTRGLRYLLEFILDLWMIFFLLFLCRPNFSSALYGHSLHFPIPVCSSSLSAWKLGEIFRFKWGGV